MKHSILARRDKTSHINQVSFLTCCLSLVNISMQKNQDTGCFLQEILMIKESYNLIGQVHVLAYNFKLCLLNFFITYLANSRSTLGHFWGNSFNHPTSILVWREVQREPRNEFESISLADHSVGFGLGTFQF